ncbi:MAG: hypothetical protein GXO03_05830 [Aquificae bacterium]|nr:hypothetical protein [Aquificota bacterium]
MLRVLLYDPSDRVAPLLRDVFEVTGHELTVVTSPEAFLETARRDGLVALMPASAFELWLEALEKNPLPAVFLAEEEQLRPLRSVGLSELGLVTLPFNPLELLNKLTLVAKLPAEEVNELGLALSMVKAIKEKKDLRYEVVKDGVRCLVGTEPVRSSCSAKKLSSVLPEARVSLTDEEVEGESYPSLSAFFKALLPKRAPAVKKLGEGVAQLGEQLFVFWREEGNGAFRKNAYLKAFPEHGYAFLVGAGSPRLPELIKGLLKELGMHPESLHAVVLTEPEPYAPETLRRLQRMSSRVGVIARAKAGSLLRSSGLSLRFRAVEDVPFLRASLPSGSVLRFCPLIQEDALALFLDEELLFTPKLLGSFNEEGELVELFHRLFFPSGGYLERSLALLDGLEKELLVAPLWGVPYRLEPELVAKLRGLKAGTDYELPSEEQLKEAVNELFVFLTDEELETVKGSLEPLAEFKEEELAALYTSPLVFLQKLLSVLPYALTKERFFELMEKLARYPFYLPPPLSGL